MAGNKEHKTPLISASVYHRVDVAYVLITHPINVDAQDAFQQTSLFIASCEDDKKLHVVKLFVDHCAKATVANDKGQTPLFGQ